MTDARKVIKRVRHVGIKQQPRNKIQIEIALWKDKKYVDDFWETDKRLKRKMSFEKAQRKLEERREEERKEKERLEEVALQRLKNLKKARRRLRWIRKQEMTE